MKVLYAKFAANKLNEIKEQVEQMLTLTNEEKKDWKLNVKNMFER